jgi:general L-amino acid transport system permease protein
VLNAYWEPIWVNRKLFAVGPYPVDQLWQPALVLLMVSLLFGLSAGRWGSIMRNLAIGLGALLRRAGDHPLWAAGADGDGGRWALLIGLCDWAALRFPASWLTWLWILSLPATFVLLSGGVICRCSGMWSFAPTVDSGLWGGLMLTMLLGHRRHCPQLPAGRAAGAGPAQQPAGDQGFSVGYIELIRGVPLITLLFMGDDDAAALSARGHDQPVQLCCACGGAITLFSAAYLAENVRGGLQAIPKGQYEAADALG